jgi:hypothetical protein
MGISSDTRKVFVVHGRNQKIKKAIFSFLRSIELHPIEWSEAVRATGEASPYVGNILEAGFAMAQAVVVLFTPDDEARLREELRGNNEPSYETELTPQARPNVIFEAGMAMGMFPKRTVLIEIGELRPMSDITGRHVIRLNNSSQQRQELANRLRTIGCAVNLDGVDWQSEGDFEIAIEAQNIPSSKTSAVENPQNTPQIKSRNLRIRKTFSDLEKDEFESEAFEFIAKFFESSLKDLESSNSHIKTRFRRIDANHFTATIYIDNAQANLCSIRFNTDRFLSHGISYSHGRTSSSDISDSLSIVDDGYQLFLKPLGHFNYTDEDKTLTFEDAAEHYWEKFIEPLQQ